MHTIARILAPLLLAAGLLAGAQGTATADTPTCDPGDYYTLTVDLADARAQVNELERQLTRQADRHADELDAMNTYLLDADERYTFAVNRHAEELAGVFAQLDESQAETRTAEALVARRDARIARLVAKVAALKAAR